MSTILESVNPFCLFGSFRININLDKMGKSGCIRHIIFFFISNEFIDFL